jgi:hypothetical protein
MVDALHSSAALPLLARLYRERQSGVLSVGPEETALRILLREGQIVGLGPASVPAPPPPSDLPRPDDSARIRLDRVLAEIGIRSPTRRAPVAVPPPLTLRARLLKTLADDSLVATFEEGKSAPADVAETAGATEPLILEAVRQLATADAVRTALGDLDRRLEATATLADERTLTLTEGYLLSRIDGQTTAHQVLQLVPLDPDETERTLLGLLLTGRVAYGAAAARRPEVAPHRPLNPSPNPATETEPEAEADSETDVPAPPGANEVASDHLTVTIDEPGESIAEPVETGAESELEAPPEAFPEVLPVASDEPWAAEPRPSTGPAEADSEILERRREILEIFQSLPTRNHFEVLGVEPGCTDAEVKRAYTALAKRYHPDVHRDPRIEDLHDILERIFISVGEAWEVLGDARSRATYEARFGVTRRGKAPTPQEPALPRPQSPPASQGPAEYIPPEDILFKSRLLFSQARYWEVIHVLEGTIPLMEERRLQHKGQVLLARAYAKNPNWVRRAEDTLQQVVREDPLNADAHYELGLLYKAGGLAARAQAMFRRVLELRPEHREAAAELGPQGEGTGGGLLKRLFGKGKAS